MSDDDIDFLEAQEGGLRDVDAMIEEQGSDDYVPSDYTQHLLLSHLVADPSMWITCAPLVKEEYFDKEFRPVIRRIHEHMKKYKDMPDPMMIHAETGVQLADVGDKAGKESTQKWLSDSVEEHCRSQAYYDHLVKAADLIEGDKSRDAIAGLLKEAQAIASMSLHRDLGHEVHESIGDILTEAKQYDNISTGLTFLDMALSGGISRPSFNLVSAASGDGKSIFMMNMGMYAAERGENVVYYSLELQPNIIMKRYGAMMTDTDINSMYQNLDSVVYQMNRRKKTDGAMYVVRFPISGTTVADIQAHHLELTMQTGLYFGTICIDYIDLMNPVQQVDKANIHLKDKFVAEEINDWTHDNELITWSAAQQTKGAQDEKVARQSGVAGGAPKINTCDNLIIGKRSDEDKENETWWAHIEKNRDGAGTKRKVPLLWNSQTQKMTNGDRDLFEESCPDLFGHKRQPKSKEADAATDRVRNDPLVKEMGVEVPEAKERVVGKENKARSIKDRLNRQYRQDADD